MLECACLQVSSGHCGGTTYARVLGFLLLILAKAVCTKCSFITKPGQAHLSMSFVACQNMFAQVRLFHFRTRVLMVFLQQGWSGGGPHIVQDYLQEAFGNSLRLSGELSRRGSTTIWKTGPTSSLWRPWPSKPALCIGLDQEVCPPSPCNLYPTNTTLNFSTSRWRGWESPSVWRADLTIVWARNLGWWNGVYGHLQPNDSCVWGRLARPVSLDHVLGNFFTCDCRYEAEKRRLPYNG